MVSDLLRDAGAVLAEFDCDSLKAASIGKSLRDSATILKGKMFVFTHSDLHFRPEDEKMVEQDEDSIRSK